MPKKWQGGNTKAVEAKERKAEVTRVAAEKKAKDAEDAYWAETDKNVLAKEQRRKEEEEKKRAALLRKKQNQELVENETKELAKQFVGKPVGAKITRQEIQQQKHNEKILKEREEAQKQKEPPLEENTNRILAEEESDPDRISARSVDEAIGKLSVEISVDKHPEKRMKAAYLAYESTNLPILKQENPSLKLSQLKEMLWKQWQKAPENPMNQEIQE